MGTSKIKIVVTPYNLAVCATIIGVFKPHFLPDSVTTVLRLSLLFFAIAYLVMRNTYIPFVNYSLYIAFATVLSCSINYLTKRLALANLEYGILSAICVTLLGALVKYSVDNDKFEELLIWIKNVFLFIFLATIVSFLGSGSSYAFGTKFASSYYIIFLTGLYYTIYCYRQTTNDYIKYVTMLILGAIAIIYMQCSTGIVALGVFWLICLFGGKKYKLFTNPYFLVASIIGSLLILFVLSSILQLGIVKIIVQYVLHKDLTLTDRMRYYQRAWNIFTSGNIFIGFGYSSSLLKEAIDLGSNIQNGLLQRCLNYGIIGGASFLLFSFKCLRTKKMEAADISTGLYAVVYAIVVAAIVEVSYNSVFMLSLLLLNGMFNYNREGFEEDNDEIKEKTKEVTEKVTKEKDIINKQRRLI